MAEMTMVGNWTGPHPSSIHQPPSSTGMRPAGAYRSSADSSRAQPPSSPPPPATGRRPVTAVAPVVDIQICMALSGRPASGEGLSPEPGDDPSELGWAAPAPDRLSWSGKDSAVPLARARALRVAPVPLAELPTVQPVSARPTASRPIAASEVASRPLASRSVAASAAVAPPGAEPPRAQQWPAPVTAVPAAAPAPVVAPSAGRRVTLATLLAPLGVLLSSLRSWRA